MIIHNADRYPTVAAPAQIPALPETPPAPPPAPQPHAEASAPQASAAQPQALLADTFRKFRQELKRSVPAHDRKAADRADNKTSLSKNEGLTSSFYPHKKTDILVLTNGEWVKAKQACSEANESQPLKKNKCSESDRPKPMHWMDDRKTASVDDFIYQWSTLHRQCWRIF